MKSVNTVRYMGELHHFHEMEVSSVSMHTGMNIGSPEIARREAACVRMRDRYLVDLVIDGKICTVDGRELVSATQNAMNVGHDL